MASYSKQELEEALQVVSSTITKCEKMQLKFSKGTSQHTLLIRRIKALSISKALMRKENVSNSYVKDDLIEALRPISSIISKCEKAQSKFVEGTSNYHRFTGMIKAMVISKSLLLDEITKRNENKTDEILIIKLNLMNENHE